jgi:hypothetical protein
MRLPRPLGVKMRKPRNEHMSVGLPSDSRHCSARLARQKSAKLGHWGVQGINSDPDTEIWQEPEPRLWDATKKMS